MKDDARASEATFAGGGPACVLIGCTNGSAAQYRAIFTMPTTLAVVLRPTGQILDASPGWTHLFGYPEGALIGRDALSIIHPEDVRVMPGPPGQDSAPSAFQGPEVRVARADGAYRRVAWSGAFDPARGVAYALGHDVTELRRAQRDAEEARAQAVQASRVKSQFLANMSHEIRTPMHGVLGMLALALDTHLTEEQKEYLEGARASAESLLTIINSILDISKIEAGKLTVERVPFALRAAVQKAIAPQLARAEGKEIKTRVTIDPDVPDTVVGDPVRFQQVLVNLLGNAVKFTDDGMIAVRMRMDRERPELVHVAVADTGIGIPHEKLSTIFDAFQQADESTTRNFGGTGLGLAICRELTGLMGGRIWVESEPGCGSTFHFTAHLPPADKGIDCVPVRDAGPVPSGIIKQHLAVLLVDDNPLNCMIARKILEKSGCRVTSVDNGLAAVERASSAEFDFVLMDIQMPQMDGYEATRRIRAKERGRRLPIFALTANAMKGDAEKAMEAGMDGHLAKPLEHSDLQRLLQRVASGAKVTCTVPPADPGWMPIDLRALRDRCDDDRELLAQVASAFRDGWRDMAGVIQAGARDGDAGSVERAAHQLKGLFGYCAAGPAGESAQAILAAARAGDLSQVPSMLERMQKQASLAEEMLLAETLSSKPSSGPRSAPRSAGAVAGVSSS